MRPDAVACRGAIKDVTMFSCESNNKQLLEERDYLRGLIARLQACAPSFDQARPHPEPLLANLAKIKAGPPAAGNGRKRRARGSRGIASPAC